MKQKYIQRSDDHRPVQQAVVNEPQTDTLTAAPLHSILQMQQTVGNQQTMQRLTTVQRWPDGPPDLAYEEAKKQAKAEKERKKAEYDKAVATPLNNIDDLITLVQHIEAAYPGESWQGIATRIRKCYYDGFLWDSMIADRSSYGTLDWPPAKVEDYKAFATAKNHPELKINGESIDIGHVFTGMDAQNFPKTGLIMSAAGVDGPAGATWGGDVGSALAEWDMNENERSKRLEYYQKYASSDDMLGDVDGIAITQKPADIPADKLSERLRWYYKGVNGGESGVSKRFTKFCQGSKFNWTGKGTGIRLDAAARKYIRGQIDEFGIAWREKSGGIPGNNWFYDADLDWFTDHFVQWVEAGLANENP